MNSTHLSAISEVIETALGKNSANKESKAISLSGCLSLWRIHESVQDHKMT